jgi:hypothetical protein
MKKFKHVRVVPPHEADLVRLAAAPAPASPKPAVSSKCSSLSASAGSAASSRPSKKKSYIDRPGVVVFLKDTSAGVRAMVVRGKDLRPAPRPGTSPKYLQLEPVRARVANERVWLHIDQVDALRVAVPRFFRRYKETGARELLFVLVGAVVRHHMEKVVKASDEAQSTARERPTAASLWESLVPEMPLRDAAAQCGFALDSALLEHD